MAFSVDGLISGLDTTSIINQLIALQKRPITLLENKQTALTDQKAAFQAINSALLKLETEVNKFNTSAEFASQTAQFSSSNSSGGSVLSVNAGSQVSAGSYSIQVTQLAREQKSVSNESFASSTTALGASGTITIGGSTNITVSLTDTLSDIRNNINSSGATVNATILNAGTSASPSYKLLVTGDSTGSANAFTITDAIDAPAKLTFGTTQSAQDALMTIDGISVIKDSNSVTDVIFDTTISLETIGSGTVTFSTDNSAVKDKIQGFVDAYNGVVDEIKTQFALDVSAGTKGALFGNAAVETIQDQLRAIITGAVPGIDGTDSSKIAFLSQVGIKTDELGHLVINDAKLTDALVTRFSDVQDLFVSSGSGTYTFVAASGGTAGGVYDTRVVDDGSGNAVLELRKQGSGGAYIRLDQSGNFASGQANTDLDGLLLQTGTLNIGDPAGQVRIAVGVAERVSFNTAAYTEFSTRGLIFTQNKSIEDRDKEFQKQIDDLTERSAKREDDLKAQFARLESLLAKLTSEQSFLSTQLARLK